MESLTELNGCLHNGHRKIKLEMKSIKKHVKNLKKIGKKLKFKK